MTLLEPRYERPPEGLARGRYAAPPWAIALLSALIVVAALAYVVRSALKAARGKR